MPRPNNVGVGVAIALVRERRYVLMGRRRGAHGAGEMSFPGGWIDFEDEGIDDTCRREVREETGLIITGTRRLIETTSTYPGPPPFRTITLFRWTTAFTGDVALVEPAKCEGWLWHDLARPVDENTTYFGGVRAALHTLEKEVCQ